MRNYLLILLGMFLISGAYSMTLSEGLQKDATSVMGKKVGPSCDPEQAIKMPETFY